MKKKINKINENNLLFVVIITFILVELIDSFLDYFLGLSLIHSILQIILYVILFIIIYYIFNKHYNKKIKTLLPIELINILKLIENYENKNILLNQKNILIKLNITKPTMKKRIDTLEKLNYIFFEKNGNHKYLKLTKQGKKIIK